MQEAHCSSCGFTCSRESFQDNIFPWHESKEFFLGFLAGSKKLQKHLLELHNPQQLEGCTISCRLCNPIFDISVLVFTRLVSNIHGALFKPRTVHVKCSMTLANFTCYSPGAVKSWHPQSPRHQPWYRQGLHMFFHVFF